MVLGTIDQDGCTRTSPVYFVPHRYRDLDWVSTPTSHHSHNLKRDDRLSAVIFESTVPQAPTSPPSAAEPTGVLRSTRLNDTQARTVKCRPTHPVRQLPNDGGTT